MGDPVLRAPGQLLFTVGPLKLAAHSPTPANADSRANAKFKEVLTVRFMYNLESECLLKCCLTLVLAPVTALSAPDGHLNLTGVNFDSNFTKYSLSELN